MRKKLIFAAIVGGAFIIGYLVGHEPGPMSVEQIDQKERADRLEKSYWWAMSQKERWFNKANGLGED
jgi:hypothetical protein